MRSERLRRAAKRLLSSRLFFAAGALLAAYAVAGFLLAPALIERHAPRYLQERLGGEVVLADVRVNPLLLTLEVRGLQLRTEDAAPVLSVERLFLDLELASLYRRAWTLAELRVEGFALAAAIEPGGQVDLVRLLQRFRGGETGDRSNPPRIVVEHAAANGTATLTDRRNGAAASVMVTPIDIQVYDLSTSSDEAGRYALAASLPGGGRIAWRAGFSMQPVASGGELSVTGLQLATVWPFVAEARRGAVPEGRVGVELRYGFAYVGGNAALALEEIRLQIDDLVVAGADGAPPLLELATVRAEGGRFDLARRALRLETVKLGAGAVRGNVDAQGMLDWQRVARSGASPPERGAAKPASEWQVLANRVEVRDVALHYADRSRSPAIALAAERLDASLELQIRVAGATVETLASQARIDVGQVAFSELDDGNSALVRLNTLTVDGGLLDTAARELAALAVSGSGGNARLRFSGDGRLELLDAIAPAQGGAIRREVETLARQARAEGRAWRYSVGRASLQNLGIDLVAPGLVAPGGYPIAVASAELAAIGGEGGAPMRFDANLNVGERGRLSAAGTIAPDFGGIAGRLEAEGVDLVPLQPLVARLARVDLVSGRAAVSAEVRFGSEASPRASAAGTATITELRLNEAGTTERLLSAQELTAREVSLAVAPTRLSIGELRAQAPEAKIVIDEERRLNLAEVLRRDAGGPAAPADADGPVRRASAFPVRIARVNVRRGTVDFSDRGLAVPFATRVRRLNGSVLGISSERASRAEIKLAGLIQDSGSASAEGAVNPSDPAAFTDIRVDFNNVAMPQLSPYAVTFAGREIESGRLWLDLRYRIMDHRLTVQNRIVLDDFALGRRVAARNALDLPLDLAVALLTDENGRISVAIPIEGDVDSPRFDYGRLLREALANLVTRVVSAPFRFLGMLAGNGRDDLGTVHFEPGSARLEPPEHKTLAGVAQVLAERPQLKLVVRGPYDPRRDGEALRTDRARRALAVELGLAPRRDPGPVAYGEAATQRALERLLTALGGSGAVERVAVAHASRLGREPQRVSGFADAFGRASPDREFYEAVFLRLAELEALDESALQGLAARRAEAIVAHLVKTGVDAGRTELGAVRAVDAGDEPAVEASLGVELMRSGREDSVRQVGLLAD